MKNLWILAEEYTPTKYEHALVWAAGWPQPRSACYCTASTVDGRGNDVSVHTGWLLNGAGAFYEDFGYFTPNELDYYGIDAVTHLIPMSSIKSPSEYLGTEDVRGYIE